MLLQLINANRSKFKHVGIYGVGANPTNPITKNINKGRVQQFHSMVREKSSSCLYAPDINRNIISGGGRPSGGSTLRIGAVAARVAHNHKVVGAIPTSATGCHVFVLSEKY